MQAREVRGRRHAPHGRGSVVGTSIQPPACPAATDRQLVLQAVRDVRVGASSLVMPLADSRVKTWWPLATWRERDRWLEAQADNEAGAR